MIDELRAVIGMKAENREGVWVLGSNGTENRLKSRARLRVRF
jgi:hypothetical protein